MTTLTVTERLLLVQQDEVAITLDGEDAVVAGYANDFATVASRESSKRVEYAWETVELIVKTKGGSFKG